MSDYCIVTRSRELNDKAFDDEILPQLPVLFSQKSRVPISKLIIDLQSIEWGNPYGALGVTLLCRMFREQAKGTVEVRLPNKNNKFLSWLTNIGFLNGTSAKAEHVEGHRFIPITQITPTKAYGSSSLHELVVRVQRLLVEEFDYPLIEAARFITALSELCHNIYDHSAPNGTPHGYIAMQAYRDTVKFAVMDLGIGIPSSLRKKHPITDDRKAIAVALLPGVSSQEGRGLGLYRVRSIVAQHRGILNIRSGRAKVLVSGDSKEIRTYKQPSGFAGTQIGILLRRERTVHKSASSQVNKLTSKEEGIWRPSIMS